MYIVFVRSLSGDYIKECYGFDYEGQAVNKYRELLRATIDKKPVYHRDSIYMIKEQDIKLIK